MVNGARCNTCSLINHPGALEGSKLKGAQISGAVKYSSNKMVDLLERIESMHKQETTSYLTNDYLEESYQRKISELFDESHDPAEMVSSSSISSSTINEVWREKICEWSYQVVDHFDFSREVVGISMHYLDRFLATRTVNKKMFQLVAMTALYLAIKLYEPGRLTMQSMIELSRGYFAVDQMAAMEMSILR
jgi:hypothetical protein